MLTVALLLSTSYAAGAADRTPPLLVRAPAISWSAKSLSLTLEQSGVLAGKKLAVFVFVDGNMIGRVETNGAVTRTTLREVEVTPGVHELFVKAGTVEATTEFRRVSPAVPTFLAALLGGLVALWGLRRWRHRRRSA